MFSKISIIAFVLAVIATVFMYANVAKAQVVEGGLVSYWPFDDKTIQGNTVEDVWGDNDGTIVGAPQIVEGKVGQALEFDGEDDYVESNIPQLGGTLPAVSFEAWVKTSKTGYNHIISRGTAWKQGNVILYIEGDFRFTIHGYTSVASSGVTPDGNWHHLVGVFDGSIGTTDNMLIYIDGALEGEGSLGSTTIQALEEAVQIANRESSGTQWFEGAVDEARIYNRALSEDEVKQNMNAEGMAVVSPIKKLALTWGEIKVSK